MSKKKNPLYKNFKKVQKNKFEMILKELVKHMTESIKSKVDEKIIDEIIKSEEDEKGNENIHR